MSIHLGTMLFQVGAVLILMLLLKRYALGPMMKVMNERQEHIEQQLTIADEKRAEAEKMVSEQKEALIQAREEAKELLERAKVQKERESEEILQDARKRADRMIQDAKEEIALEKEKAIKELRNEVGNLSVSLASKLIEKEVKVKDQSKLVESYLNQVGELQ
ncbi:F0F1 ATP synthase subunit B [Melghirimyces algeriensis]|uniref:ATP synthase subunit b n=1 Tax=Melghirimyces algeriensis TaxID=910412 RepID=A0A521D6B0_9BACL|nr:F0F1 ATP synthase subunit B [Melghirimyces algeriensis]SMO67214.1 ATP synthase F0 subcomplex B subunit [Melghirimyces algeriensis]